MEEVRVHSSDGDSGAGEEDEGTNQGRHRMSMSTDKITITPPSPALFPASHKKPSTIYSLKEGLHRSDWKCFLVGHGSFSVHEPSPAPPRPTLPSLTLPYPALFYPVPPRLILYNPS